MTMWVAPPGRGKGMFKISEPPRVGTARTTEFYVKGTGHMSTGQAQARPFRWCLTYKQYLWGIWEMDSRMIYGSCFGIGVFMLEGFRASIQSRAGAGLVKNLTLEKL